MTDNKYEIPKEGFPSNAPYIEELKSQVQSLLAIARDAAVAIDEMIPYAMQVWAAETVDRYEEAQEKKINRAKDVLKRLKAEIEK